MNRPRLLRPSFFAWLAVPAAIWLCYLAFGLPHLIWSYEWDALGPLSRSDFSQRYYTRCTWVGPYGGITRFPQDGGCPLIRFFHRQEADQ